MSIKVMSRVWDESKAQGTKLLVLLAIADFSNDEGYAWPSMATVAKKARMSLRNCQYIVRRLVEDGELELQEFAGPHRTHLYMVQPVAPMQPIAGCNPLRVEGATHCTQRVQPIAYEPSLTINEPSIELRVPRAVRGGGKDESWAWISTMGEVCEMDPKLNRGKIGAMAKKLREAGYTIDQIVDWYSGAKSWWWSEYWLGRDKHEKPTPAQIVATIAKAKGWCESKQKAARPSTGGNIPMIGGNNG
jgi:hypothetical protein